MYTTLPNGIKVFYREAGSKSAPVVLLLHGFPSSSHQYVKLINLLSPKYHVVAPDFPGYGFTEVPDSLKFEYTFANLTTTLASFLDVLSISKFAVYIFDYGAPTALRLALQRPEAITAIISQNGNAYEEGLGDFWNPIIAWWKNHDDATANFLRNDFLNLKETRGQYTTGEPDLDVIDPATYYLDWVLMERPGNKDIQLNLLMDYQTNIPIYPQFQEYFRKSQVPVLAVWGKGDIIFIPPGAEAFKRDLPKAEVHLLDAGHFAVESHTEEIADLMLVFLKKNGI
jgi:pimeloyl-ACP methyl ester carboxylesterase